MVTRPVLVFVYNADSGLFNTLTDIAHKVFSPQTYQCNLCAITYGNFAIRKEWQAFLETLDADLEFLHRDELQDKYAVGDVELPVIFKKSEDGLQVWIRAEEINACADLAGLQQLISDKLV
ncbi:MAG: hypothetical protein HXX17_02295 [Geobacteraceae bacterium]|nr:hypothetical protein [Geobacteraceae bacterium]